jgi:hypothetical protein
MKRLLQWWWCANALALGFLVGWILYGHYHPQCTYMVGFHPAVRPWSEGLDGYCEQDP